MVVLIFKLKTIEETDDSHVHKTPHTAQVQLEALSKYRPSTVTITILRGSRGQVPLPAGGPRAGPLERLRSISLQMLWVQTWGRWSEGSRGHRYHSSRL